MDSAMDEGFPVECDVCGCSDHITAECPEIQEVDELPEASKISLARQTLPALFSIEESNGSLDVVCRGAVAPRTRFGPLVAKRRSQPVDNDGGLQLEVVGIDGRKEYLDTTNENVCNWLCLVRAATSLDEMNCMAYQLDADIYYSTTRRVEQGEPLRVWYARGYARKLKQPELPPHNKECEQLMEEEVDVRVDLQSSQAEASLEILELLAPDTVCGDVSAASQLDLDMINVHGGTQATVDSVRTQSMSQGQDGDKNSESFGADTKIYTCKQCSYKTKASSDLALHITSVHLTNEISDVELPSLMKKRVWRCLSCGIVFSNPRSLGVHKKLHHPQPTESETVGSRPASEQRDEESQSTDDEVAAAEEDSGVAVINVIIERQEEPREDNYPPQYGRGQRRRNKPKHLDSSVVETDEVFECGVCADVFPSAPTLEEHVMRLHSLPCSKCRLVFTLAEEGLHRHQCQDELAEEMKASVGVNEIGDVAVFTCRHCSQVFTDSELFRGHLVWHFTTLLCDICHTYRNTLRKLENHAVTCTGLVDKEDGFSVPAPHICSICDLACVTEEALQKHRAIHKDYTCNRCGEHYYTKYGLQQHLLSCDQSQLARVSPVMACVECNLVFCSEHNLQYHKRQHADPAVICKNCQQTFSTVPDFEAHSCKTAGGGFQCEICEEKLKSSKALASHYLKHSFKFDCVLCTQTFEKKDDLINHSLECSARDMLSKKGRVDCAHCQRSFTEFPAYQAHLSEHSHNHHCTHCNRRFRNKQQLSQHLSTCVLRTDNLSVRRYTKSSTTDKFTTLSEVHHVCPICNKKFVRKDYFLNHQCRNEQGQLIPRPENLQLLVESSDTPQVVCHHCGKVFTSQSNLTKHLKLHGSKENKCDVCGKSFYHSHALRLHYDSTHTDKLKVSCVECKRTFRNKYSLTQHMKQFHSDQRTVYACEICGKIFKQKGNMTKHMLAHDAAHHYTCEYCNKTFKYPDMLKKHSLLHTQGKAFQCQQCDRSFLVKYELTKHVKEMHSNKVYVCAVCNESCRWKHTMRRHIKRKHPHYTKMAESSQYINSLLRDISEIEQNAFNKIQSELSQQVVSVQPDMTQQVVSVQQDMTQQVVSVQQDMTQQVVSQPIVISVDSLTQEQLSALASEHIVTADENGTIHLYNQSQSADGHTVDDLQKLSAILQSAQPQQLMVNNQNLTISLAGGQTIFTPVSLEDTRESNHMTTSLLRPNPVEVSQSTRQVVVDQSNQSTSHLPETTVLIAPDGSLTYTNSADQHVAFTDLSHITDGSQDDGNKMMFFNLLSASSESTVQ